ncbi:MAG: hypothetical protein V3U52_01930 [Thermoplasmata archaeon]
MIATYAEPPPGALDSSPEPGPQPPAREEFFGIGRFLKTSCEQKAYREALPGRVTISGICNRSYPLQSTPYHASASPEPLFIDIHTPKMGQRMMVELLKEREFIPSEEVREGG